MTASELDAALAAEMDAWESAGLRRKPPASSTDERVDFTTNDYLGLARHPAVIAAARDALERFGAGGRASRLLGGGCPLDVELECEIADWLGAQQSVLFPTGYQANLGVIGALAGPGDVVCSDEANHASLVDAARLSRARILVHRHFDLDELEAHLRGASAARRRLVVTEGVFSMDGDGAPLAELHELCARYDAWLVVDEAHALGLRGPNGSGAWADLDLPSSEAKRLAARIATGGKALGASGAFVVGSDVLREHLVNRARTLMFTTAPSPAVSGALLAAQRVCRSAPDLRLRTREHAKRLARGLGLPEPAGAIVPYLLGSEQAALEAEKHLRERRLEARAVRPPTVPPGGSRLRLVCHAYNTDEELARLEAELGRVPRDADDTNGSTRPRQRTPWLVVSGTGTGVGKTVVSALICRATNARYFKPVQTGDDDDRATVVSLAELGADDAAATGLSYDLPASPDQAARAEGRTVEIEHVDTRLGEELARDRRLVVELAGGLAVPWTDERTQLDWLSVHRPPLVLVAQSGLGTLNHTLLSLEALAARHLTVRALFLVGPPHAENRAKLAAESRLPVFEVPQFTEVSPAALGTWLEKVDLEQIWG